MPCSSFTSPIYILWQHLCWNKKVEKGKSINKHNDEFKLMISLVSGLKSSILSDCFHTIWSTNRRRYITTKLGFIFSLSYWNYGQSVSAIKPQTIWNWLYCAKCIHLDEAYFWFNVDVKHCTVGVSFFLKWRWLMFILFIQGEALHNKQRYQW